MTITVQPETEKTNRAPDGPPESIVPAKSGFQKRIDKLTREKRELQADLKRALALIQRFKTALRAARSVNA